MKTRTYLIALAVLTLISLAVLAVIPARAEEEPTTGVARISLIHGDVASMRGDTGDLVAATVNAPLVRGDKITTGERSQAEIQLDYANVVRLGPQTEVKIADLTRTRIQLQVAQGLVTISVFKGTEADVEIDTPNMAVRPLEEGIYRIQVNSPSETQLIVRKGEAEVATPEGNTRVGENKVILVQGTDSPEYQIAKAPKRDEWDNWNRDRDSAIREAGTWKYANRYYTGGQDLDRNGRWVNVPGYDWCWTPYVNAGWVPYNNGRWGWYPHWGWTWISYEPWGWAPYHYGRWFNWNNSWCWWPGSSYYGYYPTWAPAYVSFIGFGYGHHNFSFGFGYGYNSIGWLPLGPRDHFNPWWGRGNRFNAVNITNITNITNINNTNITDIRVRRTGNGIAGSNLQAALTNANVRRAITTASTDDFVRGRVTSRAGAIDAATLRQAQVVQGTLPAVPTRESLRTSNRPVNAAAATRASGAQNFFTRNQPPAGPRSFNEQAGEIRQMVERHNPLEATRGATPAGASAAAQGRATLNTAPTAGQGARADQREAARPGVQTVARGSDNRTGLAQGAANPATGTQLAQRSQTSPAQATQQSAPAQQPARRGWERFGTGQPRPTPAAPSVTRETQTTQRPAAAPARTQSTERPTGTPAPRTQAAPSSDAAERPGWRRFGTGSAAPGAPQRTTGATTAPQATSRETRAPASGATATPQTGTSGMQQFNRGGGQDRWPAAMNTPSTVQRQSAPAQSARPQSAPSTPAQERSGWRRFESQPRSAPTGGAQSGWNRFPAQSGASPQRESVGGASRNQGAVRSTAPRSFERPPLEIRKPIVTDRAAPQRNFGSGMSSGSSFPSGGNRTFSAPSGGNRTFSSPSGGNRTYSSPSGMGRSAPSSPSRSMGSMGGGGGRSGGVSGGGGSRGQSAPSRGSSGSYSRGGRR